MASTEASVSVLTKEKSFSDYSQARQSTGSQVRFKAPQKIVQVDESVGSHLVK